MASKNEIKSGKFYKFLAIIVKNLRVFFIVILTLYAISCLLNLFLQWFLLIKSSKFLFTFEQMRQFLTDALFILIVLDFLNAMLSKKRILYVLALLEIGFIVVTRKLILLNPEPDNATLIFVLSVASAIFFILIVWFYKITGRLKFN